MTGRNANTEPEWITVAELARLLRVDRKTAYRLVGEGLVGVRRLGRIIRIHRPSVSEWLAHTVPAASVDSTCQERGSPTRRSR